MVHLYTETFHTTAKLKRLVKRLLGREIRGPQAVEKSLLTGLSQNHIPYAVNAKPNGGVVTAGVLSDAETLRWVIGQKKKGLVKYIVAGPNIAISPEDEGGIWQDPLIDRIVVPSQWVKDQYVSAAPDLESKIQIWPAGVDVPEATEAVKQYDFLVYNKIGSNPLGSEIIDYLRAQNFKVAVLTYGKFKQSDYFLLLEQSRFEIYLSESESQGLSMFEAWARNVPTFVWERRLWEAGNYRFEGGLSASPYLEAEAGMRFKDFEDFQKNIKTFIVGNYQPRQYITEHFTNALCARAYMDIYNSHLQ